MNDGDAAHPDILWVTLESVRYDHTSISDYERDTTPNISLLANEKGSSASNAYSHGIWTRASSASILTGYPPAVHQTWSGESSLPKNMETIPEQLQSRGYSTTAISANPQFGPDVGLDRGFDDFHLLRKETLINEVGVLSTVKYILNLWRHSAGYTTKTNRHSLGYLTNEAAVQNLKRKSNQSPHFLYVHHFDTHHPYIPPKLWRSSFESPLGVKKSVELAEKMSSNLHKSIGDGVQFSGEELQAITTMYDSLIRYVDTLVGRLTKTARKYLDNPIIVITSDHGEFFGENDLLAHMLSTHSAVCEVPMIVSGLPELPKDSPIQPADIWKVISEENNLGLSVPAGHHYKSDPRKYAVVQRGKERSQKKVDLISKQSPTFDLNKFPTGNETSIIGNNYRLERISEHTNLFKLDTEQASVKKEQVDIMNAWLDEWEHKWSETNYSPERSDFSPSVQDQLSDLGYL
ncbi:Sulfatase [Halogranum gelatinilyticum]|uniref:Sulfatase n=1 Tax=Halogranum gelatinilyticum TaxID=660521 RepID=A0A1G9X8K1_9EURY|nr:sulfatase [Halogranum gelatinilyticum]SDM93129.1 Sulfatase [Halogranum gelatinilyticum]